jgi:D-3-phosphoglycerate dehydrogenase
MPSLSRSLGGCAVDVFPEEPKNNSEPFESRVGGLPNTNYLPHM